MNKHKRVFIAEDDPFSLNILCSVIKSIDPLISIDIDASAEAALQTLEKESAAGRTYDLVIADIFLSEDATGLDLWKNCFDRFRDVKLIFTSSMSLPKYFASVGQGVPAPVYLAKPYDPRECQSVLRDMLHD